MKNPIKMAAEGFKYWAESKSPSELGGMAFSALTLVGAAIVYAAGHVSGEDVVDAFVHVEEAEQEPKTEVEAEVIEVEAEVIE